MNWGRVIFYEKQSIHGVILIPSGGDVDKASASNSLEILRWKPFSKVDTLSYSYVTLLEVHRCRVSTTQRQTTQACILTS